MKKNGGGWHFWGESINAHMPFSPQNITHICNIVIMLHHVVTENVTA